MNTSLGSFIAMCLVDFCVHWRYMPTFLMVLWTSNGAVVFLYALLSRSFLPSAVFFLYALSPVSVMIKKTDLKKRYAVHPDSEFLYCSSKMKRSLNKLRGHRESHSRACSLFLPDDILLIGLAISSHRCTQFRNGRLGLNGCWL